jgi:Rha family phage regulatory protein
MMRKPTNKLALLEPSTDLVFAERDDVFCTSMMVAEYFGKRHTNVLRAIKKLREETHNLAAQNGAVKSANSANLTMQFCAVKYIDSRGKEQEAFNLTRDSFLLLAMGFTGPEALTMKLQFIDAFNRMEGHIHYLELNRVLALPARQDGKESRCALTDAIQRLIELSEAQGSSNGHHLYQGITKAIYKALGLFAGKPVPAEFRDSLTARELNLCAVVELAVAARINKLLPTGMPYKDIRDAGIAHAWLTAGVINGG